MCVTKGQNKPKSAYQNGLTTNLCKYWFPRTHNQVVHNILSLSYHYQSVSWSSRITNTDDKNCTWVMPANETMNALCPLVSFSYVLPSMFHFFFAKMWTISSDYIYVSLIQEMSLSCVSIFFKGAFCHQICDFQWAIITCAGRIWYLKVVIITIITVYQIFRKISQQTFKILRAVSPLSNSDKGVSPSGKCMYIPTSRRETDFVLLGEFCECE